MSNYGADEFPDLNVATELAYEKSLIPISKVNTMQWSYDSAIAVVKLAHRKTKTNVHVLLDLS